MRFWSRIDYDGKILWQPVKPLLHMVEQADAVLIVDDTIKKPHIDKKDLICWHHDPSQNRSF